MMQSCASAAKLRRAGPIYMSGTKAMGGLGTPPPRIVIGNVSLEADARRSVYLLPGSIALLVALAQAGNRIRIKPHPLRQLAGGSELPQRDQQLAGERHDHRLLRVGAAVLGAFAVPFDQRAVALVDEETPGELDERPADAAVAGLGKPLLAPAL